MTEALHSLIAFAGAATKAYSPELLGFAYEDPCFVGIQNSDPYWHFLWELELADSLPLLADL